MNRPWVPACILALVFSACSHRAPSITASLDRPPVFPEAPRPPKRIPAGDEPDKAAQFYLERRAGAGALELPQERYFAARERVSRMPVAAINQGRTVQSRDR